MISGIYSQNLTQNKYYINKNQTKQNIRQPRFRNILDEELGRPAKDMQELKRKYNAIILFLDAAVITMGVMLMKSGKFSFGKLNKGNKYRKFTSLAGDKDIPTVETCKSLNKKLKKIIEQRLNLDKAGEDILAEVGKSAKTSQHMLLYGPSAVGKSYFAKIYAKSMNAEYMEILFSDANSKWVGEGIEKLESRLDYALKTVQKNPNKNYVMVMNEMDAFIVPPENLSQSAGTHFVSVLRERSVLLNYMEKMQNEAPNLTLIGTTNILPKNNDYAAISRLLPVKVDMPEADCLYEALIAKIKTFTNGEQIVKDNKEQLKKLSQEMRERKFSYRDLNKVSEAAAQMHIDARVNGEKSYFKVDYLDECLKNYELTDGELAHVA